MSPHPKPAQADPGRFPRVSGDEPKIIEQIRQLLRFSPRERG